MICKIKSLLYALSIILGSSMAMADMGFGTCRIYFGNEADLPREAREIISLAAGGAVRVCIPQDKRLPTVYDALSRVTEGPLGVCRYTSHRIFQNTEQNKWALTPPPDKDYLGRAGVMMAISPGKCPLQGGPAYIGTENVSEGMFLEIVRFWEHITASRDAFDAAFARLPLQTRSSKTYLDFAEAVKSSGHRPKLELIELVNQDTHRGTVHYNMLLRGVSGGWSLFVDLIDGRLMALGLGSVTF